jgi:hypothetical protein
VIVELEPGDFVILGIGTHFEDERWEVYLSRKREGIAKETVLIDQGGWRESHDRSKKSILTFYESMLHRMVHLRGQTDEARIYATMRLLDIDKLRRFA